MNLHITKKFWVVSFTVLVIGTVFLYYFLVYIPGRERILIDKKYRVLTRMGENIKNKKTSYEQTSNLAMISLIRHLGALPYTFAPGFKSIQEKKSQLDRQSRKTVTEIAKVERLQTAMAREVLRKERELEDFYKRPFDNIVYTFQKTGLSSTVAFQVETFKNRKPKQLSPNTIFFQHRLPRSVIPFEREKAIAHGKIISDMHASVGKDLAFFYSNLSLLDSMKLGISAERFLKPILNNEFDEFFVVSDAEIPTKVSKPDTIAFQLKSSGKRPDMEPHMEGKITGLPRSSGEKESSRGRREKILYQTLKNELRMRDIDSLAVSGRRGSHIAEITIADVSYKVFRHRIAFDGQQDWALYGLVRSQSYKAQIRQVEPIIILFAALVLFFVLLGMPAIKLMVMSPIERLRISNVWFNGVSLVIGTAVLFLIIASLRHYHGYPHRELDIRLRTLSDNVHAHFVREMNLIYEQLQAVSDNDDLRKQMEIDSKRTSISASPQKLKSVFQHYNHFNEVIRIDATGRQLLSVATHPIDSLDTLSNLSQRIYFKKANEANLKKANRDTLWTVPMLKYDTAHRHTRRFALQSIHSYRDASNEVGFAIPLDPASTTDGATVLAMATRLKSVMEPQMLPGYEFCIVDEHGEVWFSSQLNKNLQENFIAETGNNDLKMAIYGRLELPLTVQYGDHVDQAYIRPINNIPLFLIVYYDLDYYKSAIIFTVNSVAMFLLLMFLLLGIHLLLLFITMRRPTRLKTRRFFLDWLRPRKDPAFTVKYYRLLVVLAFLLVLSFVLFAAYKCPAINFSFIVLPLYMLHFIYSVHEIIPDDTRWENKRAIVLKVIQHPFTIYTTLLLLFANVIALRFIPGLWLSLLIQLGYVVCLTVGFFWPPFPDRLQRFSYRNYYRIFLFSWLVLVSITPVFFFYRTAFYLEEVNWLKFLQLESIRSQKTYTSAHPIVKNKRGESYALGNYLHATGEIVPLKSPQTYKNDDDSDYSNYNNLMLSFKPAFDTLMEKSKAPVYGQAYDSSWQWRYGKEELHDKTVGDAVALYHRSMPNKHTSIIHPFQMVSGFYSCIFWILILLIVLCLYGVIAFCLRHIFGLGLLPESRYISLKESFFIHEDWKSKNIFLVGPPFSGKSTLLENYCRSLTARNIAYEKINFHNIYKEDYTRRGERIVILEHFEFGINDPVANGKRLKVLQQFLTEPATQVIVSSAVQSTWVLDHYERLIKLNQEEKQENKKENDIALKKELRLWKNVLQGFMTVYQPLGEDAEPAVKLCKELRERSGNTPDEYKLIRQELARGTFLPGLWHYTHTMSVRDKDDFEDFVLRIEELADSYYQSIWNSLTHEEKLPLYDLAKDQYVNLKNLSVLRILIQKGIIVQDDSLRIMNRSFNNFILSVVKEDEELSMEREQRDKGSWHTIRIVLVLAVLSIVAFISLAQQDILHNFNTLLTTLGAVVTLLLRFGGLFSTDPKPKE